VRKEWTKAGIIAVTQAFILGNLGIDLENSNQDLRQINLSAA
jgi:hypothetical protein